MKTVTMSPKELTWRNRMTWSQRGWASNPMKTQLCSFMGISADTDQKVQSRQSRDFRCDVRMLAGFDFTKTWTELCTEGRTEDMITRVFPLYPLTACYYCWHIANLNLGRSWRMTALQVRWQFRRTPWQDQRLQKKAQPTQSTGTAPVNER